MATFITTTLAKRSTGNTVFSPSTIEGGVGLLSNNAGTFTASAEKLTVSSKRVSGNKRVTRLRITVPQVDDSNPDVPRFVREAVAELVLTIPDGMLQADVNDLVGYVEKACASTVVNLNAILVNGEGVY